MSNNSNDLFGINICNNKKIKLYQQTSQDCSSARGGQQDSLIRLLLNIDCLQPPLVTLLSEILLEIAYNDEWVFSDL